MSESPVSRSPNRFPRHLSFIPWLVGVIFVLIWAWATGWPVYTLKTDIDQGRLNVIAAAGWHGGDPAVVYADAGWVAGDGTTPGPL